VLPSRMESPSASTSASTTTRAMPWQPPAAISVTNGFVAMMFPLLPVSMFVGDLDCVLVMPLSALARPVTPAAHAAAPLATLLTLTAPPLTTKYEDVPRFARRTLALRPAPPYGQPGGLVEGDMLGSAHRVADAVGFVGDYTSARLVMYGAMNPYAVKHYARLMRRSSAVPMWTVSATAKVRLPLEAAAVDLAMLLGGVRPRVGGAESSRWRQR
jgi:hypothetical protein